MITCPRCGYQAPDGSPWCPRCGYGCPYPQMLQQPPQMLVPYQPQQIPARYDIYDVPQQPQPESPKPPKKVKKKRGLLKKFFIFVLSLVGILLAFIVFLLALPDPKEGPASTATPTPNIEMLQTNAMATAEKMRRQTETAWAEQNPSPIPTNTPIPVIPSDTPIPAAAEPAAVSDQTGATYRGSLPQEPTDSRVCNIKGNRNSLIYHCLNSPNYDTTTDSIRWFCSPEEAEAAGYRPAKTMGGYCRQ